MARLQILRLPEGANDERPPFVLVIDQYQAQRYILGPDQPEPVGELDGLAEKIGARAVLDFQETIDIPANDLAAYRGDVSEEATAEARAELTRSENARDRLRQDRDEARQWARHGYEIGQKHCSWTDHGVAPAWLTEGWGPSDFDSCEHLKRASEYDEALTRVRNLPEHPDIMDARHEQPDGYLHGYRVAIKDAKRAAQQPPTEGTA